MGMNVRSSDMEKKKKRIFSRGKINDEGESKGTRAESYGKLSGLAWMVYGSLADYVVGRLGSFGIGFHSLLSFHNSLHTPYELHL